MSRFVPMVKAKSRHQIEDDAATVLRELAPRLLEKPGKFPAISFFEDFLQQRFGLTTGVKELPLGVEGISYPNGELFVSESTYASAYRGHGRGRFTLCHEGYHGMVHQSQIRTSLIHSNFALHRREKIPAYVDPEWQADAFAGAVLMPEHMTRLVASRAGRCDRAERIAKEFGVSFAAARYRLRVLEA